MSFNLFKRLSLLLSATALLLLAAHSASACSCGPEPTLLESFDDADEVVILRAVSVEKVENTAERFYVHGVKSTTMVVEKVFKGNLKVSERIVFGQGWGTDCVRAFPEQAVGRQYLFYLTRPEKISPEPSRDRSLWYGFLCGRSTDIQWATADLLYLENLSKVKGKTRISGSLRGGRDFDVEGKKIKIIGAQRVYETKTDKNGIFEIYDLPPGKYFVEPEVPRGWKIDPHRSGPRLTVLDKEYWESQVPERKRLEIALEPKKHVEANFEFLPDNAVRGSVIGPKGVPLPGVCVHLLEPGQEKEWARSACTDEQGRFEIRSIPKGDYVLVANLEGKPSTREPFRRIFHPNVTERDRAAIVSVAPGQTLEDVDFVIPQLEETITIEGVLRYSDGKPVGKQRIKFEVDKTDDKLVGVVSELTDSEGRFKLTILKGLHGRLLSEYWLTTGSYTNCPKVDELIAKSGGSNVTVYSNKIELTTEQNLYEVELTLPFPRCEKAKE